MYKWQEIKNGDTREKDDTREREPREGRLGIGKSGSQFKPASEWLQFNVGVLVLISTRYHNNIMDTGIIRYDKKDYCTYWKSLLI